jgi:hypothetical protein
MPLSKYTPADRHKITTVTSLVICLANVVMIGIFFKPEVQQGATNTQKKKEGARKVTWTKYIEVKGNDGTSYSIDGDRHAFMLTFWTGTYFFLHSCACAVYFVANMPVLCSIPAG